MANEKTVYTVRHEHRHGTSIFLVRSNHFPSEAEVIEATGMDYEPCRGEEITIDPICHCDIQDIPDRPEAAVI